MNFLEKVIVRHVECAVCRYTIVSLMFLLAMAGICNSSMAGNETVAQFIEAAKARTQSTVRYDGSYLAIPYPNGDVPATQGVCTDVVIRTYRKIGIDLQQRVHEDIREHFNHYPSRRIWGLAAPDPNIDHRRVPNLQTFFRRLGNELPVTNRPQDYQPGDLVTWMLPGNLPHIGIVVDHYNSRSGAPFIVHNIGRGPKMEDMLFMYPITGHFRYFPITLSSR